MSASHTTRPNHALQRTAVLSDPLSGGGLGPTGSVTGCAACHEAPAQPAPSPCAAVLTAPASGPPSLSLWSLGVAARIVKTAIQTILLAAVPGIAVHTANSQATAPPNREAAAMEQRWLAIWPERFADDSKKHIGARVRFTTAPFTNISAGALVTIKSADGTTVRVSNVPKAARTDIATPHKPPTIVTVEGVITALDADKRTVSIKASKVDVTW